MPPVGNLHQISWHRSLDRSRFRLNLGQSRADVYRRIFQVLWFSNKTGVAGDGATPTLVYPGDLRTFIRRRFPDVTAGQWDHKFDSSNKRNHLVSWNELRNAK